MDKTKVDVVLFGAGKIGQATVFLLNWIASEALFTGMSVDEIHNEIFINLLVVDSDDDSIQQVIKLVKQLDHVELEYAQATSYKQLLTSKIIPPSGPRYCINAMPYHTSAEVAAWAVKHKFNYLDFTEDVEQRALIRALEADAIKAKVILAPGQGLAPGLINSKGTELILEAIKAGGTEISCKLRVGALSSHVSNTLNYNFTWSPIGVANEYVKRDLQLIDGKLKDAFPLMDVESLFIDGQEYEAFNTSGGIGTLLDDFEALFKTKITDLNYKSIRNKGHRDALVLHSHGPKTPEFTLSVLQQHCPISLNDDYVIMFACVQYKVNGVLHQRSWSKHLYPSNLMQAIQWITALGLVTTLYDHLTCSLDKDVGFISHGDLSFPTEIINNFQNGH